MNEPPEMWEERIRKTARRFPYPPTPDLAARIRRQQSAAGRRALWRYAAALLLVGVAIMLLMVPSVRAGITELFHVGSVRIWSGSIKPTVTPALQQELPGTPISLAEARAAVRYPIRLPTYPQGIGAPDEIYLLNPQEEGIQLLWRARADYPELRLTQFGADFWVEKWGPALETQPPTTTVNGNFAIWATGPHTWSFLGRDGWLEVEVPVGRNVLIWAEADVTYRLESTLSQEEVVTIAESLRAP